jgi:ATP-dependent Clp protease adaptor protein ClpS
MIKSSRATKRGRGVSKHRYPVENLTAIEPTMQGADDDDATGGDNGVGVATRTRVKTKKPSLYKVILLNDDYTPMDFVIQILQKFFRMPIEDATQVMLHIHTRGVGICGVFTYEVAETKVTTVMDFARKNQHPLQCTLEQE